MTSYDEKEKKILTNIADEIVKFDATCAKMDGTEGKIKHFFEQEVAMHEIKSIIRMCNKVDKLEEKSDKKLVLDVAALEDLKDDNLKNIGKTIVKLDENLAKLASGEEGKIMTYIHRKEAMHEIKKILHNVGLYANYDADELKDLAELSK